MVTGGCGCTTFAQALSSEPCDPPASKACAAVGACACAVRRCDCGCRRRGLQHGATPPAVRSGPVADTAPGRQRRPQHHRQHPEDARHLAERRCLRRCGGHALVGELQSALLVCGLGRSDSTATSALKQEAGLHTVELWWACPLSGRGADAASPSSVRWNTYGNMRQRRSGASKPPIFPHFRESSN